MKYKIDTPTLVIGAALTSEQALSLPLVAPEQTTHSYNDSQYLACFHSSLEPTLAQCQQFVQTDKQGATNKSNQAHKATRCIELLSHLMSSINHSGISLPTNQPVFLLLPEFVEQIHVPTDEQAQLNNANTALAEFVKMLTLALPELFQHPQSQLFPYGRAAFPIALASANTFFSQQTDDNATGTISLISVDSLLFDIPTLHEQNRLITAQSSQGIIPSEGAIFAQLSPVDNTEEGITVNFAQSMLAPSKQRVSTTQQLFIKSAAALPKSTAQTAALAVIEQLYLPGNGDDTLQKSWLDAYISLAGHVDVNTKITQSAFFTGELGSNTGLYNFLHIVTGYKNNFIKGNTLQLEVSDNLHQGIAMYSWNNT